MSDYPKFMYRYKLGGEVIHGIPCEYITACDAGAEEALRADGFHDLPRLPEQEETHGEVEHEGEEKAPEVIVRGTGEARVPDAKQKPRKRRKSPRQRNVQQRKAVGVGKSQD